MAFQLGEEEGQGVYEMNLIPLIDIMLVLMIIFLVTATVMNPAVPLELPKTSASIAEQPPKVIQISIDKDAGLFWDDEPISMQALSQRLQAEATAVSEAVGEEGKQPTIHLRADKDGRYEVVAQVLAEANTAGLSKIAFVSE